MFHFSFLMFHVFLGFFLPSTPFRFTDSLSLHIFFSLSLFVSSFFSDSLSLYFNSSSLNVSPFFSFPVILPIRFTVFLFPLMFHRVFPSYTTHSFHRDSLSLHFNSSPLNVSPFFSYPLILPIRFTVFLFPSYTTLWFHCVFPYILTVHPILFLRVSPSIH